MNTKKNILVTGVSRGLGLALSQQLLSQGYTVYGISRSKPQAVAKLSDQYPNHFFWCAADLSNPNLFDKGKFQQFISSKTPIHGFVNNAAMAYEDLITNLQLHELERLFALNVLSPMMLSRQVIRNMLLHGVEGSIVHVSSISAHTGFKGLSMYAASKGALEAFSKNTAREWGSRKIRSNCVVAGFMETEMSAGLTDDQKQKIYQRNCLKAATNISAVVSTILFLLFDAHSTTGQNIFADAGTF